MQLCETFDNIISGGAFMKADEILKAMEEMDFDERIKLLKTLGEKHFGRKEKTIEEIRRLNYEAMYGDEDE